MFLSKNYNMPNGHGYRSDVSCFYDIEQSAAPFLSLSGPGLFSSIKFTNLFFLRIYMFVKELKHECQNHQWRRNRQGHP